MAYCTQADLAARLTPDELVALADLDGDGTADAAVVTAAIAAADALIDSYVRIRVVAVPLDPVPEVAAAASTTLAIYNLQLGRSSVSENIRDAQQDIIHWLESLSKGTATLGDDDDHTEAEPFAGTEFVAEDRVFGRSKQKRW